MAKVTKFLMTDETGQSIAAAINAINPNDAVRYSAQTLTDAQKAQARSNIGAISEDEVDVSTKADKVVGATSGHLAGLDSNGNLTDSTIPASDVTQLKNDLTELSGAVSNRNLLDNPWFTVNQRGESSYVGGGYSVDRWVLFANASNSLTVNSDGTITLSMKQGHTFQQYLSKGILEEEKAYTISILASDGTMISNALTYREGREIVGQIGYLNGCRIQAELDGRDVNKPKIYIYSNSGSNWTVTLRAVKLELGSVSTLANDIAPDYGEELRKCQRYFVSFNGAGLVGVVSRLAEDPSGIAFAYINTPVPMRTIPSITVTNLGYVFPQALSIVALDVVEMNSNALTLRVNISGGSGSYTGMLNNTKFSLSADL